MTASVRVVVCVWPLLSPQMKASREQTRDDVRRMLEALQQSSAVLEASALSKKELERGAEGRKRLKVPDLADAEPT